MKTVIILIKLFSCILLISGCVTTNYYTAKTLDEDSVAVTAGLDNLVWMKDDGDILKKKLALSTSFGLVRGLPWRLETGLRFYFPYFLEANIRHQINPASFEWFDASANVHMGIMFSDDFSFYISPPYYKYGFTISKEVYIFQPFISYYLNNNYLIENNNESISDYSIVCFGLAISYKDDLIIPEINYYKNGDFGFYSFGIGIGASLKKKGNE